MNYKILQHNVQISWKDGDIDRSLFDSDEDHIHDMIIDGYVEGELCQFDVEKDKEVYGWWKIVGEGKHISNF